MNKYSKNMLSEKYKSKHNQEYNELIDMIESGMEDFEIAEEIGLTSNYVSDIKKQIYNDMIY